MRRRSVLDDADALLQEWASGFVDSEGIGYPASPVKPTVQGDKPELSSPEEYATKMNRWGRLQSAVGIVTQKSEFHGLLLWEYYRLGRTTERLGRDFNKSQLEVTRMVNDAIKMFHEAYQQRCRLGAIRHANGW